MLLSFGVGLPEALIAVVGLGVVVGVPYFIYRAGFNSGLAHARREHIQDRRPPAQQ